jgi:putative ABC transport system substrate-binding protein
MVLRFGVCVVAQAQEPNRIPRIGYVSGNSPTSAGDEIKAFQQGLRDWGYIEGKNILVDYRYQQGREHGPALVAELLKLKVNALVIIPSSAIRAARKATQTTPIVIVTTADPVETGLIQSLARPGGNITGVTRITRDLNGKRLELLKEIFSTRPQIGILFQKDSTSGLVHFREYESAARALKVELRPVEFEGPKPNFENSFRNAERSGVVALVTVTNSLVNVNRKRIVGLAMKHRLPLMSETATWVESGGLISYSANEPEQYRRAAVYVDKILKGAKPAELPVEQPTKFELVINLKTAKQINLTIPPNVLARADRVIR